MSEHASPLATCINISCVYTVPRSCGSGRSPTLWIAVDNSRRATEAGACITAGAIARRVSSNECPLNRFCFRCHVRVVATLSESIPQHW